MSHTEYKQSCGCVVLLFLNYDGTQHAEIDYCPEHAAAPKTHEALKAARPWMERVFNSDPRQFARFNETLGIMDTALALAAGEQED